MNVHIGTYVSYTGTTEGLKGLLERFGDALIAEGFGSNGDDEDAPMKSLIVVSESDRGKFEDATHFIDRILTGSMIVVVPTEEADDGSTSD